MDTSCDWGDGSPLQSYPATSTQFTHTYAHGPLDYTVYASLITSAGEVTSADGVSVSGTGNHSIDGDGVYYSGTYNERDLADAGALPGDVLAPSIVDNQPTGSSPVSYQIDWGDATVSSSTIEPGGTPSVSHSYTQSGWYLVSYTDGAGSDVTEWMDVRVPEMQLTPPTEAVVGSGQAFDLTASYSGALGDPAPIAFVDLHDGTGPHREAVTGGSSGTIDIAFDKAPAPGVYQPNLTLYDAAGETGDNQCSFYLDVWGVKIDQGEKNDVLIASPDGTQNLQQVTVLFPHPAGEALDLTLTSSNPTQNLLWDTSLPTAGTTVPVIGHSGSSYTFSVGPDESSVTFWDGATAGNTTADVLTYTVGGTTDTAASTTGFLTAMAAGSATVPASQPTSNPASQLEVKITSNNDPNGGPKSDGSRDWLVGQMVDLTVTVIGLDPNIDRHYSWTVPPGSNVLREWNTGTAVPLTNDNGGTGRNLKEVKFFWVSTSTGQTAPESDVVTIKVNFAGRSLAASTTFNVYTPESQVGSPVSHGSPGIYRDPADGLWHIGMQPLAGIRNGVQWTAEVDDAPFPRGEFTFVQLVASDGFLAQVNSSDLTKNDFFIRPYQQIWALDGTFPYGDTKVDPFDAPDHLGWKTALFPHSHSAGDTPNSTIDSDRTRELGMNSRYHMYVMYKPSGVGSQWVPLLSENWGFHVSVYWLGNAWTTNGLTWDSVPDFTRETQEPIWNVVQPGGWAPKP